MVQPRVHYFKPAGIQGLELLTCPDVNYLFPPHFHQAYCIWLNTIGGERYTHRGNSYILSPQSFGIIAPGEVHSNRACDNNVRSLLTFYLDPVQVRQIGAQITDRAVTPSEFRTASHLDRATLQSLLDLQQILRHSPSALERQSAFVETVANLIRRHAAAVPQEHAVGAEPWRVARIIELFHARLAEDVSLNELAAEFDCTPYHLIRFFKKAVGLAPHAYLIQLRLEKAKQLLGQGESIVDAALDTGFSDQSHLTRRFKAKFGVPPGNYLKQIAS